MAPRRRSHAPPGTSIRAAVPHDAAACLAIYAPYVEATAISFEERVPGVKEMRARIAASLETHAWVVMEEPGPSTPVVLGYAYGGPYKSRPAYRWACEVSVYVALDRRRSGAGRALYEDLFARLAARGFRMVVAGMTLPNPASLGLHRALGFEDVGTWRDIGWKFDTWHDVHWMQRRLVQDEGPPREPA